MKLTDITFFSPEYPPFERVDNPNDHAKSFLTMLLNDPVFQESVLDVRKDLGISENGLDNSNIEFDKQLFEMEERREVKYFIDYLIIAYNLPEDYRFRLYLLIIYNAFLDTTRLFDAGITYSSYKGDDGYRMAQESKRNYGAIYLFSKVTKKDFLQWLDENWNYIEEEMHYLPEVPTAGLKYKNLYIAKRIDDLRKEGMSYTEISDTLSIDYPDNEQILDIGWLKTTASRYRNAVKAYGEKIEGNTSVTFDVTE